MNLKARASAMVRGGLLHWAVILGQQFLPRGGTGGDRRRGVAAVDGIDIMMDVSRARGHQQRALVWATFGPHESWSCRRPGQDRTSHSSCAWRVALIARRRAQWPCAASG
ncbi:hypothetical protein EV363DRAFT_1354221 [Boletus edulis]|nr:hypothetical protein EV363DRAFT_1354221 [Boletus edulis]